MAKCCWTVLCRKSLVDKTDNNISLLEVMDNVNFVGYPPAAETYKKKPVLIRGNNPEAAHLVSMWWREKGPRAEEISARLRIVGPGKRIVFRQEFRITLKDNERARHILKLPGIFYCGPGRYSYVLDQKNGSRWTTVSAVFLNVGLGDGALPKPPSKKFAKPSGTNARELH